MAGTWEKLQTNKVSQQVRDNLHVLPQCLMPCINLQRLKKKKKKEKCYLLESVIQSKVSQKEKNKYCVLTHICGI